MAKAGVTLLLATWVAESWNSFSKASLGLKEQFGWIVRFSAVIRPEKKRHSAGQLPHPSIDGMPQISPCQAR